MHLNIRSLFPKIDQIRAILPDSTVQIITFSETWLNTKIGDDMLRIDGYSLYRKDRTIATNCKKRGGGLVTYVKNSENLTVITRDDISTSDSNLEAQWLEIRRKYAKDIVLCNIYRPPTGNIKKALKYLTAVPGKQKRHFYSRGL